MRRASQQRLRYCPPTLRGARSVPSSRRRWRPRLAYGPARQSRRPHCPHRPRRAPRTEVPGTSPAQPPPCDAIGVSPRRVVNLPGGCGIHRLGPEARGVRCHRAGLVCKTGLPHRHHQCPAGPEELGGFTDSPTRRVRAVVTDEDRRSRRHPCERLGARYFKPRWHDIAQGVSRRGARLSTPPLSI